MNIRSSLIRPIVGMIAIFLTVMIASITLAAEPTPVNPDAAILQQRVVKLMGDAAHQNALKTAALDGFSKIFDCSTGKFELTGPVSSYGPLNIDEAGHVTGGLLTERSRVTGCGNTLITNILTGFKSGNNISVFGMPGTTKADPTLARDTVMYVFSAATLKIRDCKQVKIINTEFVEFFGEPNLKAKFQANQGRPWREIWTIDVCGKERVPVPVEYVPDETGTTIVARHL